MGAGGGDQKSSFTILPYVYLANDATGKRILLYSFQNAHFQLTTAVGEAVIFLNVAFYLNSSIPNQTPVSTYNRITHSFGNDQRFCDCEH